MQRNVISVTHVGARESYFISCKPMFQTFRKMLYKVSIQKLFVVVNEFNITYIINFNVKLILEKYYMIILDVLKEFIDGI